MWTVIQEYVNGELDYRIMNKETGEKLGAFDSDRNAQAFANAKNEEEKRRDKGKGLNRPHRR